MSPASAIPLPRQNSDYRPEAIIVMGPSGCGKTTLARGLARKLNTAVYIEGDDHHPSSNIAKLSAGHPLSEAERETFIDNVGAALEASEQTAVLSCSALRRAHRERLRQFVRDILFVWIDLPAEELQRRVDARSNHFMPASLLPDQLAVFEQPKAPERFIRIDGMLSTQDQIAEVLAVLPPSGNSAQT